MNHRLSPLQRTILRLGFSNRQRRKDQRPIDVTRAEVLSGYYGWLVTPGHRKIVFSRYRVGPARYNSAQVSLTKAMQRLRKRGLIQIYVTPLTRSDSTSDAVSEYESLGRPGFLYSSPLASFTKPT